MKLSTKLSHAKLRFKHRLLSLRLQQPIFFKTISVLFLTLAVGGIVAAYFLFIKAEEPKSYADQFSVEIEAYSLNGKVASVEGDMITVEGTVIETVNGANTVKSVLKKILLNPKTAVYITTLNGQEITSKTGTLVDIRPGNSVTIYTPDNPIEGNMLNATKVEVIE